MTAWTTVIKVCVGEENPTDGRSDTLGTKGWVRWPSGFCLAQMNGCWRAVKGVAENRLFVHVNNVEKQFLLFHSLTSTLHCHFGLWLVSKVGKEPSRRGGLLTPGDS